MKQPLISIVIPTLNSEKFIGECLQSVSRQTYTNYEIIIVDGGSADSTLETAGQANNARIISQTDKGLAGAWNDGIRNANGGYIAFLDSDDKWDANCLINHMRLLESQTNLTCSIGHMEFFLDDPQTVPAGFKVSLLNKTHLAYMPGCFLGKKEIFQKIGLFETKWQIASDIVWFAKLKNFKEETGKVEEVVLYKRVHGKNLSYSTAQTPLYQKELLQFLHELRSKSP